MFKKLFFKSKTNRGKNGRKNAKTSFNKFLTTVLRVSNVISAGENNRNWK